MKRVLVALMIVALFGMTAFAQAVTTTVTPEVTQTVTTTVAPICDEPVTAAATEDRKAGPLLGFSVIPAAPAAVGLTFGGYIGDFNLEIWKGDLTTPFGRWNVGALWTPQIEHFGYRVGANVLLRLNPTTANLIYKGFGFVLGVSNTWGPIQLHADVNILPFGALAVIPVVGVNILFSELIPDRK